MTPRTTIKRAAALAATALVVAGCAAPTAGQALTTVTDVTTDTTTVREQVAPAACVEAIRLARNGFAASARVTGATIKILDGVPDALEAAFNRDADGIDRFTQILDDANVEISGARGDMDADAFNAAAAECEGSGS